MLRMARMPSATSSRATWATSTFTFTQRKLPTSPLFREVAQGDEGGGLAGLARRVQHEVALGPNQGQKFIDIHPVQRPDGVVVLRAHRPFGVEEAHGSIMALAAYRCARGTAPIRSVESHWPGGGTAAVPADAPDTVVSSHFAAFPAVRASGRGRSNGRFRAWRQSPGSGDPFDEPSVARVKMRLRCAGIRRTGSGTREGTKS